MAPLGPTWPSRADTGFSDPHLHPGLRATFTEILAWTREALFHSQHSRALLHKWGKEAGDSQRDVFPARRPPASWKNESVISPCSPGSSSHIFSPEFAYEEGTLGKKVSALDHRPNAGRPVPAAQFHFRTLLPVFPLGFG